MNKKFLKINKTKWGNDLELTTLLLPLSRTEVEKTRCQREREHILGAVDSQRPRPPGLFVPECDDHGHYAPIQCHGSTGYCWCVDRDGREVQGTRTRPGVRPPCKSESHAGQCWGPLPGAQLALSACPESRPAPLTRSLSPPFLSPLCSPAFHLPITHTPSPSFSPLPTPSSPPFLFLFGANLSCANDGPGLLDKTAIDSRECLCAWGSCGQMLPWAAWPCSGSVLGHGRDGRDPPEPPLSTLSLGHGAFLLSHRSPARLCLDL